jgi:hypothetical protein
MLATVLAFALPISSANPQEASPTAIVNGPDGVDCLLASYAGDGRDVNQQCTTLRQKFHVSRIIAYPDDYIPVIIHKDRIKEAQKLLGPEMMILSPRLGGGELESKQ